MGIIAFPEQSVNFCFRGPDLKTPGPVQYTRPWLSTSSPSGMPGSSPSFMSAKMRRFVIFPAASILSAWMYFEERVLATYSVRSSGKNARPSGYSHSATRERIRRSEVMIFRETHHRDFLSHCAGGGTSKRAKP